MAKKQKLSALQEWTFSAFGIIIVGLFLLISGVRMAGNILIFLGAGIWFITLLIKIIQVNKPN